MENLNNCKPILSFHSTRTNKYKWLIDNSIDMISIHYPDGRYSYVSPSFTETLGYKSCELLYKFPGDFIHKDDLNTALKSYESLLLGQETVESTFRQQMKNGEYMWLEAKIKAIRDETGEILEILSFTRDISEKVKYETTLLQAKHELNNIISNQQGMVIQIIKEQFKYIYAIFTGELVHVIGWTPEEVVGKTPYEIFEKETADYLVNQYDLAWESQEKVTFEYTTSNGYYLLVKIKPIVENGEVIQLIGSCVDITPLKEAEQQLIQSEKLSVVGELSAGIAHEIRNPLTAIKGFLQIMKMEQDNKYFEIMESEINRIEFITNEFMVLSRPRTETRKKMKLCTVMEDVLFLVDTEAFKKRITIKQNIDEDVFIEGEEYQIKQVFLNIIKNAIESMSKEGVIHIDVTQQDEKVFIKISDQGCGIPPEKLTYLGKPFYTTKQKGNGLGLMICYKIIKKHCGSISVESKLNEGTTFTIELPKVHHTNE
ncbi:PAS domain-containing sensor histidine kinase [Alkalihalobacillus sp. BA299]|uniref:PAS domain-containing sensor histidine kinase n=1 Tax=Alkalihalobacillus sp. BA299 TaxID=2815938 RepID=UPI001ADB25E9|nr:PAS domain-containing sensor histidine kinase [Alkalihalobacillus sp. BA299]